MKNVIGISLGIILLFAISYEGWKLQRFVHYKFSYQSQVEEQIKPLIERISVLEKKVGELESKKLR